MTIELISERVNKLTKKYDETDPGKLAKAMGILVSYVSMGDYDGCCKGFMVTYHRIKHITINSDLAEEVQKIILAHELGHADLHSKEIQNAAFHDVALFDDTDIKEYQANIFAAELLLPDEKVLLALNGDSFFFQAASRLCVPAELLDFKFRVMKRKGYKLEAPFVSNGDFLKKIKTQREK